MCLEGGLSSESSLTVFTEERKVSGVGHLVLLQVASLLKRLGTVDTSKSSVTLIGSVGAAIATANSWRDILNIGLNVLDGQRVGQARRTVAIAIAVVGL